MPNARTLQFPLLFCLLMAFVTSASPPLNAQTLFWDGPNMVANGVVDGGTGTWMTGETPNWTNATGSANETWAMGNAVFSGAAGTVTVFGVVTVTGIRIETDGYVITEGIFDNTPGDLSLDLIDGVTATISTIIGGSEGLVKAGGGTLILTGANSYFGDTAINGGILQVSGDGALGLGANLTFDGGTLATGASFALARPITLFGDGGELAPAAGTTLTVTSAIGGTGSLTFSGEGTTTLTGANTYTGGTVIESGVVNTTTADSLGSGDLEVNGGRLVLGADTELGSLRGTGGRIDLTGGNLTIGQAVDATFAGIITGTGSFTKAGGALLVLTGNNTYSGGTFINAGTLAGSLHSLPGDITNNATLELRDSGNVELDRDIKGSGDLVFAGTGTTTVTKNQSYTGSTTVQNGTLLVNAGLESSNVVIGENGIIGGDGVLKGDLNSIGLLTPGNSPGTLRINGDLTLGRAGSTRIEIASETNFDRLIVGRTARLNGELEVLLLGGFDPEPGDSFEIITARRVVGRFSREDLPASVQFDITYNPGSVVLSLDDPDVRIPYPEFALNQNQFNTATALETLRTQDLGSRSDFDRNVRPVLDMLPAPELRDAFEQVTPTQSLAFGQTVFAISRVWLPQMSARLADIRAGSRGFVSSGFVERGAADMKDVLAPVQDNKWGVWVDGSGVFSETASFEGLRTGDASSGQASIGVDYKLSDNFTLGLYTGYIGTWTDFGGGSDVDSNGSRFGIYSTYQSGGFYLNSVIGGEWNCYDWDRRIQFPGIDRRATAETEGSVFETLFGGGYDWKVSECLSIGVFSSLEYTLLFVDGFTESGAGSLNLRINDQDADSLRTNLGAQIAGSIPIGSKFLRPSLRAAWRHEYLDGSRRISSALNAGAGPGFSTRLPGGNRGDSLLLNGGVSMDLTENVSGYLYYTGDIAGTATENIHALNTGIRITF